MGAKERSTRDENPLLRLDDLRFQRSQDKAEDAEGGWARWHSTLRLPIICHSIQGIGFQRTGPERTR